MAEFNPQPVYTAPTIAVDQDNYNPDPDDAIFAILMLLSSSANVSITGFAGNTYLGDLLPTRLVFWTNIGGNNISGLASPGNWSPG